MELQLLYVITSARPALEQREVRSPSLALLSSPGKDKDYH